MDTKSYNQNITEDPNLWSEAKKEWDQISETAVILQPGTDQSQSKNSKFQPITSSQFLLSCNLDIQSSTLEAEDDHIDPACCCFSFTKAFHNYSDHKTLQEKYLETENNRRELIALTGAKFQNDNIIHTDSLITIYRRLNNNDTISCPRFGKHWSEIGFQGSDPTTDFRSAGLLPIYLMLKSSETISSDKNTFQSVFNYFKNNISSNDEDSAMDFPFCLVSINITVRIIKFIIRQPKIFYNLKIGIEEVFVENLKLFCETWVKNGYSIREAQKCLLAVENNLKTYDDSSSICDIDYLLASIGGIFRELYFGF